MAYALLYTVSEKCFKTKLKKNKKLKQNKQTYEQTKQNKSFLYATYSYSEQVEKRYWIGMLLTYISNT